MPPNTAGAHPRLAISMAISAARRCSVPVVAMTSINNPTVKAIIRRADDVGLYCGACVEVCIVIAGILGFDD